MTNDVSIVDDKDKITMDINGDQHLNMLKDTMRDRIRLYNPHIIKDLGIVIFICILLSNVAMLDFSHSTSTNAIRNSTNNVSENKHMSTFKTLPLDE